MLTMASASYQVKQILKLPLILVVQDKDWMPIREINFKYNYVKE